MQILTDFSAKKNNGFQVILKEKKNVRTHEFQQFKKNLFYKIKQPEIYIFVNMQTSGAERTTLAPRTKQ